MTKYKQYLISFVDKFTGLVGSQKIYESTSKKRACLKFKQEYPFCEVITVCKIEV